MRLVTYRAPAGPRIGVVLPDARVLDVRAGGLENIVGDAAAMASLREAADAGSAAWLDDRGRFVDPAVVARARWVLDLAG